ncbi:PEP-CTERM sorting domain-containing protein [Alteromonas sp. CYL-A6]|uniref:PEP-CTERM sorting domain-containing protein n=1 Tax=Alteromonas nitratireducens TaxID=3390813 RepID=UPI0034A8E655
MRYPARICVMSVLMFASFAGHASLIINGSFEDNDVRNGSWKWYNAANVNGWHGSNIEIWDSLYRFDSFDGEQHAELNAHGGSGGMAYSIFQTFTTEISSRYLVSFAYAARSSLAEAFRFDILGCSNDVLFSQTIDDHTIKNWSEFSTTFVAVSTESTIRFTSLNGNSTVGNFLDAINVAEDPGPQTVISSTSVPEPATMFLSAMALTGFLVRRRSLTKKT